MITYLKRIANEPRTPRDHLSEAGWFALAGLMSHEWGYTAFMVLCAIGAVVELSRSIIAGTQDQNTLAAR